MVTLAPANLGVSLMAEPVDGLVVAAIGTTLGEDTMFTSLAGIVGLLLPSTG